MWATRRGECGGIRVGNGAVWSGLRCTPAASPPTGMAMRVRLPGGLVDFDWVRGGVGRLRVRRYHGDALIGRGNAWVKSIVLRRILL